MVKGKGLSFNIPQAKATSTEIARPSPVISRWRPAKHIHGNKREVSAMQLTREQALIAQRLLNIPWLEALDYIVSYRDGSVRAFKKATFEDTYHFTDGPDNADD
jgi:hypothetical protein